MVSVREKRRGREEIEAKCTILFSLLHLSPLSAKETLQSAGVRPYIMLVS